MKFFVLFSFCLNLAFAGPESIIPDRISIPFIEIFSKRTKELADGKILVSVSDYKKDGSITKGKSTLAVSKNQYNHMFAMSQAVFQMIPNENDLTSESIHKGTAFHIGNNLVLTNHHVLSPDRTVTNDCNGFELLDNESSSKFKCKRVVFCNNPHDVCLIEMEIAKICKNFLCNKFEMKALADGPKLFINPNTLKSSDNEEKLSCIGNTMGLGIHYSEGSGYRYNKTTIQFYAPLRTGNSGGPLLNEKGEVVGVVKQETKIKVGNDAFNVALGIPTLLEIIEDEVRDEKTLQKINQSILKKEDLP